MSDVEVAGALDSSVDAEGSASDDEAAGEEAAGGVVDSGVKLAQPVSATTSSPAASAADVMLEFMERPFVVAADAVTENTQQRRQRFTRRGARHA